MKEILLALWPIVCMVGGFFMGKFSGRLDEKIKWLRRCREGMDEQSRFPMGEYRLGYFHGVCHVYEGKPPDDHAVERLLEEIE